MAQAIRRPGVKQVPLSEIQNDLSRFLSEAQGEEIVITRNGKPAGMLIGFSSEDDWLDYRLENDPRFSAPDRAGEEKSARSPRRQDRGCRVIGPLAQSLSKRSPSLVRNSSGSGPR